MDYITVLAVLLDPGPAKPEGGDPGRTELGLDLASSVTRGEQRVLADARHSTITTDHPDAVMQAIRDLLDEVRHGPARA